MIAKIRIAVNCYQIQKNPEQEKLDLVTGIFNLVSSIQSAHNEKAKITLAHGAGSAADLWAGNATMDLGIPLEIYLPFPRITHIVRSKMNPIQAESLNLQIDYANKIKIIHKKYNPNGLMNRIKTMVDYADMVAIWGDNKKAKNFWDYSRKRKKPTKDLIFYSLFQIDNIHLHLQGDL